MKENIILYSNGCPRCEILKEKLDNKNIKYEICNDIDLMIKKGFTLTPMLEIDGVIMNFAGAIQWVGKRE